MTVLEQIYEKLKTAPPAVVREVMDVLKRSEEQRQSSDLHSNSSTLEDFIGRLKYSKTLDGDPVEIQRAVRNEWA
jgi:hypothetical protein